MTVYISKEKSEYGKKLFSLLLTLSLLTLSLLASLLFSERISHSVKSGLSLCANIIIPSVFPFIIISDALRSYIELDSLGRIGGLFERTFKINRSGLYPFIMGIVCGFPLGVKCASELYQSGNLTKDEAERLIGFCNNTGPAFLIAGIGVALRKSFSEGVILYLSMILSAITVGIVFGISKRQSDSSFESIKKTSFSITASIKNAGLGTLYICSYITFFACCVGLLRGVLGESYPYLALIPFIEVGSAVSILSKTSLLTATGGLLLSGFAIGFSGLSVHLQSISYLLGTDLSTKRYFLMKFIQGLLTPAFVYLFSLLISII